MIKLISYYNFSVNSTQVSYRGRTECRVLGTREGRRIGTEEEVLLVIAEIEELDDGFKVAAVVVVELLLW